VSCETLSRSYYENERGYDIPRAGAMSIN
jgi:hypothetical protein